MGAWKVAGWILIVWFSLASGLWVFAAIYWGWKSTADSEPAHIPPGQEADALAAGVIGYQIGKRRGQCQ
ncbi:MAG: hypothetical protein ABIO65_11090 [Nitrospiria bacterium]